MKTLAAALVVLSAVILAAAACATPSYVVTDREAATLAYDHLAPAERAWIERRKCGPDGAVDWDDNTVEPPPHCNTYRSHRP